MSQDQIDAGIRCFTKWLESQGGEVTIEKIQGGNDGIVPATSGAQLLDGLQNQAPSTKPRKPRKKPEPDEKDQGDNITLKRDLTKVQPTSETIDFIKHVKSADREAQIRKRVCDFGDTVLKFARDTGLTREQAFSKLIEPFYADPATRDYAEDVLKSFPGFVPEQDSADYIELKGAPAIDVNNPTAAVAAI